MTCFGWSLILGGFYGLYQGIHALGTGNVINPPDYPGDWEHFEHDEQTLLYWINTLLYLIGGIGGIAIGSKGLGWW